MNQQASTTTPATAPTPKPAVVMNEYQAKSLTLLERIALAVENSERATDRAGALLERIAKATETRATFSALPGPSAGAHPVTAAGGLANDYEMSGEHGDPMVTKRDPPRWQGESYVGKKFSECPADYLETLASFLDWKASKTEEENDPARVKFAAYDRKDARRARTWAHRKANGHVAAPAAPPEATDEEAAAVGDDEIPF